MANKERQSIIDAQWQTLQLGWGPKEYDGERQMLYDLLEEEESVKRLWSGGWKVSTEGDEVDSHDRGIIVATEHRALLMNRGRLSKTVSEISYSVMSQVKELDPGKVRISEPDYDYDVAVELWASDLAAFLQERMLSGADSTESELSHVLENGERLEHWARCSAGRETVLHTPGGGGSMGSVHTPESWQTSWSRSSAIAVPTDRRILLIDAREKEVIASCPHGTIMAVEHTKGKEVRFVNRTGQVYAVRFQQEADPAPFVNIMREHAATAWRVSLQPRITAEWQLHHPIWHYRNSHKNERDRLGEILDDDEHLQALLWASYSPEQEGASWHSGVIAATNRRLLFVSNSWDDKHVSQLPLHGIAGVSHEGGELHIDATPEYSGYLINGLDDMSRHHSREKGQVEMFTARLQSLVADPPPYTAAPDSSLQPDAPATNAAGSPESKRRRVERQWRERSNDWDTSKFKNEMSMLCDILADDEDIECLIDGYWKEDVQGQGTEWGVIAATDRRVVYVYNGMSGPNVAELPYWAIGSVHMKKGLMESRITITTGGARNDWVVTTTFDNDSSRRLTDCLQSLTANPLSLPESTDSLSGGDFQEALAKRQRLAQQWRERSNGWDSSVYKNEQEKLSEILDDGEDIECLIHGYWKTDVEGMETQWGVTAATLRRLIYVYNGREGLRIAELPYGAIKSVHYKKGLIDCRIAIAASDGPNWVISSVRNGEGRRFTDCVQEHARFNAVKA